jgi:hypothetical protein
MILSLDVWLLPAIAASSASYLVCLGWERYRKSSAPSGPMEGFLAALSFLMGAICAYYRYEMFAPRPETNIIIMFLVGGSTTYLWLLLRKYLPALKDHYKR